MVRSAVSKLMWLGRATSALVGLAILFALAIGAANNALAHTNVDNKLFHLGHSNSTTTPTTLVSTLTDALKSALIVQNKSGGPALDLRVGNASVPANEVAPMKVNSNKVVTNLNADQLDGKSDTDFYAAGSKVADSSHADQADSATNAGTLDNLNSTDFASSIHSHSGADITSGTVAEPRVDGSIARDNEIMPTVRANDGSSSGVDADFLDGLDSISLQRRVATACPAGSSIRAIDANGDPTCETDDDSGTTQVTALRNELGTNDGTPNQSTDPVSFNKVKDIPTDVVTRNADRLDGKDSTDFLSANQQLTTNNIAKYAFSQPLNFASLAPGGCSSAHIGLPTDISNDIVVVTPGPAIPNQIIVQTRLANVSNDTFQLVLCNFTSSAIDPPSANFNIAVFDQP